MQAPLPMAELDLLLSSLAKLTVMVVKHWMMELEKGLKHTRMRKSTT